MARRLKDNISSSYFEAAQKLYPRKTRRRIIAYVESYEDVGFWRALLAEFETDECYFQVMLPSATNLSKGKKMVLLNTLNTAELGKSMIACVDSDFDFLMQDTNPMSHKINRNKYIFQTYAYAIESYQCYAEGLHNAVVQATLNDKHWIDYPKFLARYSEIIYPLFLWMMYFQRQHDVDTFPMHEFNQLTLLRRVNLYDIYESLDEVKTRVSTRIDLLKKRYPQAEPALVSLGKELETLGLRPQTTYLYIQGHHLMDNVVMKLLTPICAQLRREREREIRRLAEHDIQYHNELTAYDHSQIPVNIILKKTDGYRNLYLYQWLRKDLEAFLNE
jgi:hypothetical protein